MFDAAETLGQGIAESSTAARGILQVCVRVWVKEGVYMFLCTSEERGLALVGWGVSSHVSHGGLRKNCCRRHWTI